MSLFSPSSQTQTQYKNDVSHAVRTLVTVLNSTMQKNSSEFLHHHSNRRLMQKVNLMQEREVAHAHSVNMIGKSSIRYLTFSLLECEIIRVVDY